ncbi:McrB family protein [Ruminococcus flavefaciens]|uniref:McrB family protein n=1 Tax=Ruminococcus flavefaciens TaxID=1265 RepID=UPI0026EFEB23|nr:AAA family ATPase [Ruminococcus flavefaciens]
MAIPKITYQNVLDALKYIDENGIPSHNQSTQYDLVSDDGKKYPPKYVIAVADHIANGTPISVDAFHGTEAKKRLEELGFMIELKQEKYILTITADSVSSTDDRFSIDKLEEGDNYKPLDVHMEKANGDVVKRNYAKGERRHSNQTMARIAFQVYEQEITALSVEQKEAFPVCKYNPSSETIYGIYSSVDEFRKHRKSIEYMTYSYGEGRKFVIYCWNIFSTIIFVQECLKRFGNVGDKFVLTYRDKDEKELGQGTNPDNDAVNEWFPSISEYDPGLTVSDWKALLQDSSVFDADSIATIKTFIDNGGQAALSEIAARNGKSKNFNKSVCERLAQRVIDKTNCPSVPESINQDAKTWPVLFVGRPAKSSEMGSYIWRVRDELRQAWAESESREYRNPYSKTLIESKNIIFRGAPGTGKSYLAKEIAADIISNGYYERLEDLTNEQKKQVEFVQFHPSYDYSDFVEGLRPQINSDGTMGFTLQDGVFKKFITRARKNYEDSQKSTEAIEKEMSVQDAMTDFFDGIEFGVDKFQTINGNEFTVTSADEHHIYIYIPNNPEVKKLCLSADEIRQMLESGESFSKIKDITRFFGKQYASQGYSYNFALYNAIKAKMNHHINVTAKQEELKKYIFIIDEINRGEISKIFGELFFAIDPGYRGRAGEVSTQYANLHSNPDEKFFIPENVYIIGTMNDIDRSVDSFDFAMRRRFRFIEIKADARLEMLATLDDEELEAEAIRRMTALNNEIVKVEELNENYQIGASYFLKLKTLSFDQLWTDYLQPLLQDYVQGMYDEAAIMSRFAKAYGYQKPENGNDDETA